MIARSFVLALFAVALAACGRDGSAATLNEPIQLAPGQSAVFESGQLSVQFVGIGADSRCPSDTTCVWAGEVVVQFAIRQDDRTTQQEIKENESGAVGAYSVTVLGVLPIPSTQQRIAPADYRVTLKVTRS
jgi:uncharacterized lipoprotein YajG